MESIKRTALICCVFATVVFSPLCFGLTIAADGKTRAVVVVGDGADEAVKYAADELARFLGEVTGADFAIQDAPQKGGANLLVGPEAARLIEPGFSTEGLGADGIVIRTKGSDLILAGGRPRGTLYAVYTFLAL